MEGGGTRDTKVGGGSVGNLRRASPPASPTWRHIGVEFTYQYLNLINRLNIINAWSLFSEKYWQGTEA